MRSHAFTFFLFGLLFLTAQICFAQKPPNKFGKIDMEDMKMTHYPLDSSAHAVVLCDYGYANFECERVMEVFFINYDRYIRYKIIDKAGYDFANYSIPLYQPSI